MAIQNDNTLVTKGDLKSLYTDKIAPYLGGGISYYYTDRSGQELKSGQYALAESVAIGTGTNITVAAGAAIPFVKQSGDFVDGPTTGSFIVPAGMRIEVTLFGTVTDGANNNSGVYLYNETDGVYLDSANSKQMPGAYFYGGQASLYGMSQSCVVQWTNNTGKDIAVSMRNAANGTVLSLRVHATGMTVKEIGRIVDPVKYVDNNSDLEETPVGNIISYMGNSVPKHYLACDGHEYPIGSYPELEAFIINEFGSINYFGGDGSTTWAVPDLRGEFLRGAGTNSHTNQGDGGDVGEHQDGTEHTYIRKHGNNNSIFIQKGKELPSGLDASVNGTGTSIQLAKSNETALNDPDIYTSRPTNTSVNYCIKYESTFHAFFSNAAYKVSVGASVLATQNAQVTFDSANIIGDSSLVSGNTLVAPMDGWYSLGMNWSTGGESNQYYYALVNGNSLGFNNSIGYSNNIYLNKNDTVEIFKYTGVANSGRVNFCLLTSNYNPTIVSVDSVYSENEQMIGYWKDGKPLYQKTLEFTTPSTATDTTVLTVTNSESITIQNIVYGTIKRADGGIFPVNFAYPSQGVSCYFVTNGNVTVMNFKTTISMDFNRPATVTIQYTKTTDTASTLQVENSLLLNRPDLWTEGQEYHFGGGLYGTRFAGTVSSGVTAGSNVWTQIANRGIGLSSAPKVNNYGGWIEFESSENRSTTPVNSSRVWQLEVSVYFAIGGGFRMQALSPKDPTDTSGSHSASTMSIPSNAKYDVWITYTK